jgi:hypothetical protein
MVLIIDDIVAAIRYASRGTWSPCSRLGFDAEFYRRSALVTNTATCVEGTLV